MNSETIDIIRVNYSNTRHAEGLSLLMSQYALDVMGGGEALSEYCLRSLANELAKREYAYSVMAFVVGEPAGLINCFESFSTFSCAPLVNIHDVIVSKEYRGLGLSQKMLVLVEEIAKQKKCCKLTIEVLTGNEVAQSAYKKFGFDDYRLDPAMGHAVFWQKKIC